MTDDLVTWLRQQLDDDERVATNDGKLSGDEWSALEVRPGRSTWEVVRRGGGVVAEAAQWEAEHIAHHDPARVLAEVDGKRRILDRWAASQDDVLPPEALIALDDVVKMLSLPYAERPGYREGWRP